ncbi:hypothetical protein RMB13_19185 [Acinetobacter sp. V102_4]|uniref:hypothetical protein n=1 Tax=Acinetobacter sp. V102_4 TaxID=3072984 RepID=UPI00287DA9C0|nr:hypothetical protein [Acinetobacter sp. V102_4]MDS7931568.1 hypothetical protein [Acinetobacter sp. V102_4]
MSKPISPHEQDEFDQFEADRDEQIQQIMAEKGCSEQEAEAIWEEEYEQAISSDDD